jgi:hypothetical protein
VGDGRGGSGDVPAWYSREHGQGYSWAEKHGLKRGGEGGNAGFIFRGREQRKGDSSFGGSSRWFQIVRVGSWISTCVGEILYMEVIVWGALPAGVFIWKGP